MANSSKKNNLNQAAYELFGVGKKPEEKTVEVNETKEVKVETPVVENFVEEAPKYEKTYLAPGVSFEGVLKLKGDIEIAGDFKGDIECESVVTLRKSFTGNIKAKSLKISTCSITGNIDVAEDVDIVDFSTVNGNITANNVVCSGKVVGDIVARESIKLSDKADVLGNITTKMMSMESGALVKGDLKIGK